MVDAIGERIKNARTGAGMSQAELADKAGLSQSMISRIEQGQRDTPLSTFRRIAEALGLDPAALLQDQAA